MSDGDRSTKPIAALGTTGVFVTALREALLLGSIDLVVHSFKDLPAKPLAGLCLAAVPAREDPRDALVDRQDRRLVDLPAGARIGTGAARRSAELRRLGLPVTVVPIRGNLDRRLAMVESGAVDAVIVAAAGLIRLGLLAVATEILDPERMLPAPAQGALAVECREEDRELREWLAVLDDPASRMTTAAERSFLARLDVGCGAPVGAYARLIDSGTICLDVCCAGRDGTAIRRSGQAPVSQGCQLGLELADAAIEARGQLT